MGPLTDSEKGATIKPELSLGQDLILRYPFTKGTRHHALKILRVADGTVYVLDPSSKEQVPVGRALWMGSVLVMAMTVKTE